jgi:hypothetical protein
MNISYLGQPLPPWRCLGLPLFVLASGQQGLRGYRLHEVSVIIIIIGKPLCLRNGVHTLLVLRKVKECDPLLSGELNQRDVIPRSGSVLDQVIFLGCFEHSETYLMPPVALEFGFHSISNPITS